MQTKLSAILLKRSNFAPIVHWTRTTYENCEAMLQDALNEGTVRYIVFWFDQNGHPQWMNFSEEEFVSEYGLKQTELSRFDNHFSSLRIGP